MPFSILAMDAVELSIKQRYNIHEFMGDGLLIPKCPPCDVFVAAIERIVQKGFAVQVTNSGSLNYYYFKVHRNVKGGGKVLVVDEYSPTMPEVLMKGVLEFINWFNKQQQ